MSEYQDFLEEKNKFDTYLQNGYEIQYITENLSGMFVSVYSPQSDQSVSLHIKTPNGRKYVSTKIIYERKLQGRVLGVPKFLQS